MCPVAAESKNSKPSSKKKINKKINTNLGTVVEEDLNPYYSFKAYMKNFARQLDYNSQNSDGAIIYTIPI